MTSMNPVARLRREPPAFRRVTVQGVTAVTPRMMRVNLAGPELEGLVIDQPASSVRLLLPPAGTKDVVMPTWNGNEFLLPDGSRPALRTLTPLRSDPEAPSLEVEVVIHEGGALTDWVAAVGPGDEVALSGPGRGYPVDADATDFLLGGDESAIPAIGQVLDALSAGSTARVLIEVANPDARLELPAGHGLTADVTWLDLPPGAAPGTALVDAVTAADITDSARIWVAGEAAAMQRIRRHLFDQRGIPRAATWIRGYWKAGRAGDADDD